VENPAPTPPPLPKVAPPRQGRTIRVQLNPLGDWQDSCRQALHVAAQFTGNDMLVLHIPAHKLEMSFPNKPTLFCPELADALEAIQGVRRVEVEL
ncbi:MAG: hypothetical protein KDE04_26310, partial [Anaerolineales bacterium]|nr:hypothetical protein [Anaerolineales bacterium]